MYHLYAAFIDNGFWFWDNDILISLVGQEVAAVVKDVKICSSVIPDKIIWMPTSDGLFTLKSAWGLVQPHANVNTVAKAIEKLWCAPKVQLFSWKIMHNIVVTDDKVASMGICYG